MKIQLGTLPDWLSGVAGAGAVLAALIGYFWEKRRTEESRRDEVARERRSQAERITYYLEFGHSAYPEAEAPTSPNERTPVDAGWFHHHDAPGYDWGYLVIVNNSGSCTYLNVANVPQGPSDTPTRGIGTIPPGTARISMPMRQYPGEGSGAWTRHEGDFGRGELVPWIEFKDQAGVTWRRGNDGTLREITAPEPFPDYSV